MIFQSTHPLQGATAAPRREKQKSNISIHAPLAGCDGGACAGRRAYVYFNPRTPCRVRLFGSGSPTSFGSISIHAPLAGCDDSAHYNEHWHYHFNPRTPCRVRHLRHSLNAATWHFNPRTPCRVRPGQATPPPRRQKISIHAPLAGCDEVFFFRVVVVGKFQSTHPLQGATEAKTAPTNARKISIHAPLAGCDTRACVAFRHLPRFQSTHPLQGATSCLLPKPSIISISIHAPLAGCDRRPRSTREKVCHFNPRTPCRVRHQHFFTRCQRKNFNPRTPCRVRPARIEYLPKGKRISIHAPLAGCDSTPCSRNRPFRYFNPRTPCRVRLPVPVFPASDIEFQSTHPLQGATGDTGEQGEKGDISIHAPLAGCDRRSWAARF